MVVREVAEELLDHLLLVVGEIRYIIQFMNVAQVGEYLLGIHHVLIHVVKVGKQQLSPTVEMIQGFINARTFHEGFVQIADRLDRVSHLQIRMSAEKVADGDIGSSRWACVPAGPSSCSGRVMLAC